MADPVPQLVGGGQPVDAALAALRADAPARVLRQLKRLSGVDLTPAGTPIPGGLDQLTNVMIEGGGQVAAGFLSAGLVDRIEWFRAPIVLGDEGRPAVGDFVLQRLADAPRFRRVDVQAIGDDLWERYERL